MYTTPSPHPCARSEVLPEAPLTDTDAEVPDMYDGKSTTNHSLANTKNTSRPMMIPQQSTSEERDNASNASLKISDHLLDAPSDETNGIQEEDPNS